MQIEIKDKQELAYYFEKLKQRVFQNELVQTKYIDLGVTVIRVLCYTKEIIPLMEKQLTYTLRDEMDHYDSTLVVWKETQFENFAKSLGDKFNPTKNMRLRVEKVYHKGKYPPVCIMDKEYSNFLPAIRIDNIAGIIEAYDVKQKTCYYGVADLSPEEFIKQGHIFVQPINELIKTDYVNLAHGAIIGYNNNGFLFCARGQRGKSTLTVHAMMHDFEYVSDDYQILEQRENQLYSYPIYSIITLSPEMYNELYNDLQGKFVSNNARKDKYVINIAPYHHQFKKNYPIRLCIFPEIVSDKEPSIQKCSASDKGRAIVQLIHSTVMQMRDLNNKAVIQKMFNMVQNLPFYKLNLCRNIDHNTEYLRQFLQDFDFNQKENTKLNEVLLDITFDLANILDTRTFTIYSMNKFATNVYENLLNGFSAVDVRKSLEKYTDKNPNLLSEFDSFVDQINQHQWNVDYEKIMEQVVINPEFIKECNYKLFVTEFAETETKELVVIKKGK